jgi:threonyl-tRNA synthetase
MLSVSFALEIFASRDRSRRSGTNTFSVFRHRERSHKELPLRLADFGVLHRNEASGALSGLTRVRRFQQDDAHVFCREDQVGSEVADVLDFMKYVLLAFPFQMRLGRLSSGEVADCRCSGSSMAFST